MIAYIPWIYWRKTLPLIKKLMNFQLRKVESLFLKIQISIIDFNRIRTFQINSNLNKQY